MSTEAKVLPKPVDWDELYPGRFIKAGDFKGEKVTLRISMVKLEELVGDKGPQIKGVIGFEKTDTAVGPSIKPTASACAKCVRAHGAGLGRAPCHAVRGRVGRGAGDPRLGVP